MIRAKLYALAMLLFLTSSGGAMACAVCGGMSDAPMAKGMNWGIFSLLVVIGMMLAAIASFFVFLAKKAAQTADASEQLPLATKNV